MSRQTLLKRMAYVSSLGMALTLGLSACGGGAASSSAMAADGVLSSVLAKDGTTGPLAGRSHTTDLLIYDGVAAAFYDDDSLEDIAKSHGLTVRRVSSDELNQMSEDEMATYGAIVWPGGYADEMSGSLSSGTRGRIRDVVMNRGVGFMGICAGAWMAVGPTPATGANPDWGLAIVPSPIMDEYTPSNQDDIEMTPVTVAGLSQPRDLVWWGGPALPNWQGGVVAKYKDGKTPAIIQGWAGHGFVVLTSPHPEAPQVWRDEHGLTDADGTDFDLAFQLIQATLDQKPLQAL